MLKKKDNNLELIIRNVTQILMTKLMLIFSIISLKWLQNSFFKKGRSLNNQACYKINTNIHVNKDISKQRETTKNI